MMKRILTGLFALAAILSAAFLAIAPGYVESRMNTVEGALPEIRPETLTLHASLEIVDLHSDTLLWQRSFAKRASRGHVDAPRLRDGNVTLQILSSVTKSPKGQNYDANGADTDQITTLVQAQLQPVRTWGSLLERSLWHGQKLDRVAEQSKGKILKIASPEAVDTLRANRASDQDVIGAMLSIEGLQNLEGDASNLDRLYQAGFRMAGITHFFDNELAGSMHGLEKGGLTPLGREVIARMEDKGMMVDIAHCSSACVADILAMATRPVVSSHGGVQATCDVNRNLSDEQIKGVAKTGGLIGIGYWDGAICDTSPASIAKAMKHVRDLVGIEHVALGSDYDGSTTVRFDTAGLAHVTQALVDAGFTEDEIRAAMGGNALRVLRAGMLAKGEGED